MILFRCFFHVLGLLFYSKHTSRVKLSSLEPSPQDKITRFVLVNVFIKKKTTTTITTITAATINKRTQAVIKF